MQEALVISGEIPLWLVDGDDGVAFVNDAAVRRHSNTNWNQ